MGETIRLTAEDGHAFDAYKAMPEGTPRGGIVVIQEIFGVNNHIRNVTERFAGEGYAAIAPALFDRVEAGVELGYDEPGVAKGRELKDAVGIDGPLADIAAAAKAIEEHGKTGAVGYCWGGLLAFLCATRLGLPAVGYYGGGIASYADEKPQAPLMLHFGEQDHAIPMEQVERVRQKHPEVPLFTYPEAGHGFSCEERGSFHKASHEQALERTLAFFAEQVG